LVNHLAAIGRTPAQFRFPFALWTLPLIGQLIERKFGVVLHATTIPRRLHRLGLSPQRPVRRAVQRDADACLAPRVRPDRRRRASDRDLAAALRRWMEHARPWRTDYRQTLLVPSPWCATHPEWRSEPRSRRGRAG